MSSVGLFLFDAVSIYRLFCCSRVLRSVKPIQWKRRRPYLDVRRHSGLTLSPFFGFASLLTSCLLRTSGARRATGVKRDTRNVQKNSAPVERIRVDGASDSNQRL